jgi:hypothetical protein
MAPRRNSRRVEDVRRDLEHERNHLATAADSLRDSIGEATDITGKLRSKLPAVAAGALVAGFMIAGGVGATARFVFRRGRERSTKARLGRVLIVDDD